MQNDRNDLISRQAAIEKLISNLTYMHTFGADRSIDLIEELPSAQPEIIRCKDCKYHFHDAGYGRDWCNRTSGVFRVKQDDFCSRAERRTE